MNAAGLEGLVVSTWITQTLTQNLGLVDQLGGPDLAARRIVEGVLPEDQPLTDPVTNLVLPWVTFTVIEPQDVRVVGLIQVMTMVEFQVRVTTPGATYGPAADVYRVVHDLLDGKTNQVTPLGVIDTCERIAGIQFPERANGQDFRHLGGLYRTYVE